MTDARVVDFPQRPAPPHNIEVEQALLGAILVNNDAYHQIAGNCGLTPDHFFDGVHAQIYELCAKLIPAGRAATPALMRAELEGVSVTDDLSAGQYLGTLAAAAVTVVDAPNYAKTVKELAHRRDLLALSVDLADVARDMATPIPDACRHGLDCAGRILADQVGRQTEFGAYEAVLHGLEAGATMTPITTGLADIDETLGGFHRGELMIVGGRASMGKSLLATGMTLRTALAGEGVYFASLEMSAAPIGQRLVADLAWNSQQPIPYFDIARGRISDIERQRLLDVSEKIRAAPIRYDDKAGLTLDEVRARAHRYAQHLEARGQRLSVVVVDHLLKIRPTLDRRGNRVQEVGDIVGALAVLAKDLDVAVMALTQINRAPEARSDNRPTLSDLRWSGAAEEDADSVLLLYRPAYYLERQKGKDHEAEVKRQEMLDNCRNKLEIIVAKNRNGPIRTVTAFCNVECNVLRDLT